MSFTELNGSPANIREGKPRIAKFCDRYCIIGTDYGYIHTNSGGLATWKTYSGAYKALRTRYIHYYQPKLVKQGVSNEKV